MTKQWLYRPVEHDDWGIVREAKRDENGWQRVVCRANYVASPDELTAHRINGTDPAEANARLIAAAPDLLAVAQRILDRGYVCPSIEEEADDHAMLRAAITKATPEDRS